MDLLELKAPTGEAWLFLVLFGVVVGGPVVVERLKIPGIIGLFLGGLLVGPHGLGLIGAGNTTVPALGKLGLLYLMFVAGLELDLALVRLHRRSVAIFSALTFAMPMVAGTGAGFLLGFDPAAAVLLGSLVASHTLIVYPIIRRFRLGSDRAVATGVGATVVTDTLALVVLAIVVGSTGSDDVSPLELMSQITLGLGMVALFSFVVLPRAVAAVLAKFGSSRTNRYLLALVALLSAATVADVVGIEPIIGAFFAGLALNRLVPTEGDLMHRIDFFGSAVFVPVFIVSVGLVLDPLVLVDPGTLKMVGIFVLACLGGKALAVAIARPLLRFTWPQAAVLFSLTTPQAAATLAVADVGLTHGLFGASAYNAVLGLVLVSLIVPSFVASVFGRRVPVPQPSGAAAYGRRVLLVTARGTDLRAPVADLAVRLASTDRGVVHPVIVLREGEIAPDIREIDELEQRLAAAAVDLPVSVRVDRSWGLAVDHAVVSSGATAVVVDDADGSWRDELHTRAPSCPVPLMLVGRVGSRVRRVVACPDGADGFSVVDDIANRLAPARTAVVISDIAGTGTTPPTDPADLVVATTEWEPGRDGEEPSTMVTVISPRR